MVRILTFGEALVEIMRTGIDQPLHQPGPFTGPYPSGAPFIFAMQAARLGAEVRTAGAVGADAFGRCLLDQLRTDGVDTTAILELETHSTGVAFVAYAADGSRDFVFHVADAAAGQITPQMLDVDFFDSADILHLMGSTLSIHEDALQTGLRALELAQEHGVKISFDPNLRPQLMPNKRAKDLFAPFVQAAEILIPTTDELSILTEHDRIEDAARALFAGGSTQIIIVTHGAGGCTVITRDDGNKPVLQDVAGFPAKEIDPTGAGDCFDAGFLVRWLAGDSPLEAARFANACGALAVMARGPAAGARLLDDVRAFMDGET